MTESLQEIARKIIPDRWINPNDKTDQWLATREEIIEALKSVSERVRETAIKECASRIMMDCPCEMSVSSRSVCEHRFVAAKILSLLDTGKDK